MSLVGGGNRLLAFALADEPSAVVVVRRSLSEILGEHGLLVLTFSGHTARGDGSVETTRWCLFDAGVALSQIVYWKPTPPIASGRWCGPTERIAGRDRSCPARRERRRRECRARTRPVRTSGGRSTRQPDRHWPAGSRRVTARHGDARSRSLPTGLCHRRRNHFALMDGREVSGLASSQR